MTVGRAFSLLELMVSLGLGAIMLVVVTSVVVPLTREIMRGYEEMDLSRTALRLEASWGQDLRRSTPSAVNLAGPRHWLVRRLEAHLAGSQRVFSQTVVLYDLGQGGQLRRIQARPSGQVSLLQHPDLPPSSAWAALLASPLESRLQALGVESLVCEVGSGLVTVTAELSRQVSNRTLRYRWQQAFAWENQ